MSTQEIAVRAANIMTMGSAGTISDGMIIVVRTDSGPRIQDIGPYHILKKSWTGPINNLGEVTICPGLTNCHTHLELSHLAGTTRSGEGFPGWADSLHKAMRTSRPDPVAVSRAIDDVQNTGTVFVADMAGFGAVPLAEALQQKQLNHLLMVQLFGFAPPRGEELWTPGYAKALPEECVGQHLAYAGHSLYSTHPKTLQLIKKWCRDHSRPFALHLAESAEEVELLQTGRGRLADLLRTSGRLPKNFEAPGRSPVGLADHLGLLDDRTQCIHCVHISDEDTALLAERGCTVVLCPRSNDYIGVGRAPWRKLKAAKIPMCLGTDGLTSNTDLDLRNEMRFLLSQTDVFSLHDVVSMVTVNAAAALGPAGASTLEQGEPARWVTVPQETV
jgi:cytosine/adenosine deaminase-related metal-dependent hydrolase